MFILVYGEDAYRLREKEQELRVAFSQKFDAVKCNEAVFEIAKSGKILDTIGQALSAPPFLAEKRLVVLRGVFGAVKKEEIEDWVHVFSRATSSTICLFVEESPCATVEKHALYKAISPLFGERKYTFPILAGRFLTDWLSSWSQINKAVLSNDALYTLIDRVGADSWRLTREIKKLQAFCGDAAITKREIEEMVVPSEEGAMFECMDAIATKSPRAWQKLLDERESGTNDVFIFSMLVRQVRLMSLARLKLNEDPKCTKQNLADELSIHPFVAGKQLMQAGKFSSEDLTRLERRLSFFDERMKTGVMKPDMAVYTAVATLLQTK